jgi:hypothetical protein
MDGGVCPVGGELTYVDGQVECSIHKDEEDDENNEDEDEGDDWVPFL